MIVLIQDIHEKTYEFESPHTNIKSVIESISKTKGFLEVRFNKKSEIVPVFLAVDKIVSVRELTKNEIEYSEFWKF